MPNSLAREGSVYLRQHMDDPIDWLPWGEEAFERARRDDLPVFLSIGYSSCHWCHVMAHESFRDPEVARALNGTFVCIKVDREERPDVDELYMAAVQLETGRGGWPMSLFLTPDKKPFFVGTYFPREGRGGMPGFLTLVTSIAQTWYTRREEIQEAADRFAEGIAAALSRTMPSVGGAMEIELFDAAVSALAEDFDEAHGGFGGRPKFPPHTSIAFLLAYAEQRAALGDVPTDGNLIENARRMALTTLRKMALGGIHDHVGGGFHRYSVDERWFLPHFEKMLVDNAQLLSAYVSASALSSGAGPFERARDGITRWMRDEMTTDSGLFCASLDADSGGEEGAFYTWTLGEIDAVLKDAGPEFRHAFGCRSDGNYQEEHTHHLTGRNILALEEEPKPSVLEGLLPLLQARAIRVIPGLDDKAIAAWNGLAIGAMARAGDVLPAERCARHWIVRAGAEFDLPHQICAGEPSGLGFLDDFACLAKGLMEMYRATGGAKWRDAAEGLASRMLALFGDGQGGALRYASDRHEFVLARSRPAMDQAMPGPNAVAASVLLEIGMLDEAERVLLANLGWAQRAPRATMALLEAMLTYVSMTTDERRAPEPLPNVEVAVRLEPEEWVPGDDGWARGELVIDVPGGWHINSHDPTLKWLVPTQVTVEGPEAEAAFPASELDRYEGAVRIPIRLRADAEDQVFSLQVVFQACTESLCLAPQAVTLRARVKGTQPTA